MNETRNNYYITHHNRATRVQAKVNPLPADKNTEQPEVRQSDMVNRSHSEDGRLTGTKG